MTRWQGFPTHSLYQKENITMLKFIGAMLSGLVTMGAAAWLAQKAKKGQR